MLSTTTVYAPKDRRPIAEILRRTADIPVMWCARAGVHPNFVSYSSILASLGAGLCFWQASALPALLILG